MQAGSRGKLARIVNGIILSRALLGPSADVIGTGACEARRRKRRERIASWECEWDNERGRETGEARARTGLLDHDDSKRFSGFHAQCPIDMAVSHKPDTGFDLRYRPPFPRPSCFSFSISPFFSPYLVVVVVVVGDKRDSSRRSARSTTMSYRPERKRRAI